VNHSTRLTYNVRAARAGDREVILGMVPRLRAFGSVPLRSAEELDNGEARTLNRYFDSPPDGAKLWVAESKDLVAGAAYVQVLTDYFTQEQHGHLGIFMVAQANEGHGVAGALLEAVERWASDSGFRFLTLNVFTGNQRAVAFYEHYKFVADYVRYIKPVSQTAHS
jgi:GNAT superfamily N-acetyltransferase